VTNSITPPNELAQQWYRDAEHQLAPYYVFVARCAAQWGADQELEACCEQLKSIPSPLGVPFGEMASNALRAARRPKPPSLKEQALEQLRDMDQAGALDCNTDKIRAALEALPND
jgi:hypothetical protein